MGTQKTRRDTRTMTTVAKKLQAKPVLTRQSLDVSVARLFADASANLAKQSEKRQAAQKASEGLADQYGLRPYDACDQGPYPTEVISMQEFQRNLGKYAHKLAEGISGFPVGLKFDEVNTVMRDMGLPYIARRDALVVYAWQMFGHNAAGKKAQTRLINACEDAGLSKKDNSYVYLSPLDFLANYDHLVDFVLDQQGIADEVKKRAVHGLQLARAVYFSALEIVGTTRIKDPVELLGAGLEPAIDKALAERRRATPSFKDQLKDLMLAEPSGTSYKEIQAMLPIKSKARFKELAAARTEEILFDGKKPKMPAYALNRALQGFSVGRALFLACYFARTVIEKYENHDDGVKRVFTGRHETRMSGKCSDYAGLAAHYLNQYLAEKKPELFKGWSFGVQVTCIGEWNHAYLKAVHVNPDRSVDVYFLDPTQLAQHGVQGLKTPKALAGIATTKNHPVLIRRNAEDLLYRCK